MGKFTENPQEYINKAKAMFQEKVEAIRSSESKLKNLLERVKVKLIALGQNPTIQQVRGQLDICIRMVKAHSKGEYKGISNRSLGLLVLALVYFISPVDLIPDFIPVIGYVDDLSVILAVFKSVQTDIEKFLEWERTRII
ncbi:YkvA family protein [Pararhodonellum marinum]|uniref:YkvA family protein n=1 Tax=Pararhodonellum marinum TaxID=2755358 RepID=UPI00188FAD29|nr:YkvA family protein [Pararhodonellum marinum]